MIVYFGIALLIFIGVIVYATYTEEYPDGNYFRPNKGDHQALIALIGVGYGLFWPITVASYVLFGLVKLIVRVTTRLKEKHESAD